MKLMEVPFPALQSGCILVRNHFSAISTGTEGKTVLDARKGFVAKAMARKEEVKKVIKTAQNYGVMKTYRMVMDRLESPSSLGYSCAGEIIAVADDVREFRTGDYVACGGNTANHSEIVCIPKNLAVKLSKEINLQHAAFTTIGAIAMQGFRQAELQLGETCVVIGLGFIGQLTLHILKSAGIKPIGIDIDAAQINLALQSGIKNVFTREDPSLKENIFNLTNGAGTDAVIITASTSTTDPVDLAGILCRKKGKVVIVGAVPTGFARKNYYQKELELRMSTSYGAGRYDDDYEQKGIDYPIGYVRWTEKRNMQSFAELLEEGKIPIEKLITHQFPFEKAMDAYRLIVNKEQKFSGIVLNYDTKKSLKKEVKAISKSSSSSKLIIGLIGAGSFAQNFLLPELKKQKAKLAGVATARPNNSMHIAQKFGFEFCTGNASELINHPEINTIFIATRHHLHSQLVIESLKQNKNVYVEKPLCTREENLEEIRKTYENSKGKLIVGYNRRFAPLLIRLKSLLKKNIPVAINYRINAGTLPPEHWVHDAEIGGGRIIGEVCHFMDLCRFIVESKIISVSSNLMKTIPDLQDSVNVSLSFENGSIANISYFSNGSKQLTKEYLEIFCGGDSFILDDFKNLTKFSSSEKKWKLSTQDKGYANEIQAFCSAMEKGNDSPIPFEELYNTSLATFKIIPSAISRSVEIIE